MHRMRQSSTVRTQSRPVHLTEDLWAGVETLCGERKCALDEVVAAAVTSYLEGHLVGLAPRPPAGFGARPPEARRAIAALGVAARAARRRPVKPPDGV